MRGVVFALALMLPAVGLAQTPKPLAFDVASVRLSDQKILPVRRFTPGRVELVNVSLDEVVGTAFDIKLRNRLSVPGWLSSVRVEIRAASSLTAPAQVREMLRTLLVERFGLVTHTEQRPFDVHELTVAGGGHKMRQVEALDELAREYVPSSDVARTMDTTSQTIDGPVRSMRLGLGQRVVTDRTMYEVTFLEGSMLRLNASRMSMAELAGRLMLSVGAEHVVDRTGLPGLYQFVVDLPNNPRPSPIQLRDGTVAEPPRLTAAQAVESLGLKLERRRAPVDVIVVDAIERTPREN